MASRSGDATRSGPFTTSMLQKRKLLLTSAGDTNALRLYSGDVGGHLRRGLALPVNETERHKLMSDSSVKMSSLQLSTASDYRDRNGDRQAIGDQRRSHNSATVVKPSTSQDFKKRQPWLELEQLMATKEMHVQQKMEEHGIAHVYPATDQLEEQIWRVVQGEVTMQEVADLV